MRLGEDDDPLAPSWPRLLTGRCCLGEEEEPVFMVEGPWGGDLEGVLVGDLVQCNPF